MNRALPARQLQLELQDTAARFDAERRQLVRTAGNVVPFTSARWLKRHERTLLLVADQLEQGQQTPAFAQTVLDGCAERLDTYHATRRLGANAASTGARL